MSKRVRTRHMRSNAPGHFHHDQIVVVIERWYWRKLKMRMATIVAYDKSVRRVLEVAIPIDWLKPAEAKR